MIYFDNYATGFRNKKAVVNYKIDMTYIRKVLKTDIIPFVELQVSRRATFKQLVDKMVEILQCELEEAAAQGDGIDDESPLANMRQEGSGALVQLKTLKPRLHMEDEILTEGQMSETLEAINVPTGQLFLVEFIDPKTGKYESDKLNINALRPMMTNSLVNQSTQGLMNPGDKNNCYMNSALQCLANMKHFHQFFVRKQRHVTQINLTSQDGYQGRLVKGFARILKQLWGNNENVDPQEFKDLIGSLNDLLQGDEQQDTQEFIAFLLNGIHEDINLRRTKPYLQNPESDNRNVIDLALEMQSNELRRDWSFISFMRDGQVLESLECTGCKKQTHNFQVMSDLPLSLPEPKEIGLEIVVHVLPGRISSLLMNRQYNPRSSFEQPI